MVRTTENSERQEAKLCLKAQKHREIARASGSNASPFPDASLARASRVPVVSGLSIEQLNGMTANLSAC